jgi:predicted permease
MERELEKELRFHFEQQVRDDVMAGMTEEEARREAQIKLGGMDRAKEECRDARGTQWLESTFRDVAYALRSIRLNPAFSAVVVFSLALGIGGNTAVFSVMDSLLLKRLPVKDPIGLVVLYNLTDARPYNSFSYPVFEQFRQRNRAFSGIFAVGEPATMRLTGNEGADQFENVQVSRVSAGYFSVLGVEAVIGRTIQENDEQSGDQALVVISDRFWQRRFARDPQVIGKKITLNNAPFTVIGVTAREFFGVEVGRSPDVWLPLVPSERLKNDPGTLWMSLMARIRPELTLEAARREMDALYQQMKTERPTSRSPYFYTNARGIALVSGATGWTPSLRDQFTFQFEILISLAGLVLLVACANVSSLLLARGAARRRELTIRLAIGSGRFRLIRQLFAESAVLAVLGGAFGLLVAYWGTRFLLVHMPNQAGAALNAGLDGRALAFTTSLSVVSATLLGIVPAIRMTKLDLSAAANNRMSASEGYGPRITFQRALIIFQLSLSLIMLVAAGLFIRTLHNLRTYDAGFDRDRVVRFSIDFGPSFNAAQRVALRKELQARLDVLPGIGSVAVSSCGLLDPCNSIGAVNDIEGYTFEPGEKRSLERLDVGAGFFATVGLPILVGREFAASDEWDGQGQGPRVAVINQKLANIFFRGINPVGRHLHFNGNAPQNELEIIGVVKDSKYRSLREETFPVLYLPFSATAQPRSFVLRTRGDLLSLANTIRETLKEVNPRLALGQLLPGTATNEIQTMGEIADASILRERLIAQLASFFAFIVLFLVCIGFFGLVSYSVRRRTKEIGIRMAVGARGRDVRSLFFREMFPIIGIGVVIGLTGALSVTRLVSSLLFRVAPTDVWTIVSAGLLLSAAAVTAAYLPVRRALRVNPTVALRYE